MADTISWSSGGTEGILGKSTITIQTKNVNNEASSLALVGTGVKNYGPIEQQNIIRLLENFASANQPANPTIGQLWFNPVDGVLYLCVDPLHVSNLTIHYPGNGIGWVDISSAPSSSSVISALGYTPYNATNPSGYISGITSANVISALGYTPYPSTNPYNYISSITYQNVVTALGFTPYSASNPNSYISSSSPSNIISALGYTPVNKAGDTMTGNLVLSANPTAAMHAATKQYVDAHGVTSVTVAGAAGRITGGGTITSTGTATLDLAASGVAAGYYGMANINVDAYGRITSAGAGTLTVQGVGALAGGGVIGQGGTAQLNMAAIHGGGTFTNATVVLDSYGRVTSAASGASGSGIGAGQSWHNVNGARSFGTAYYNPANDGRPWMVIYTPGSSGGPSGQCTAVVNGLQVAATHSDTTNGGTFYPMSFVVPANGWYYVTNDHNNTASWVELY
jgi:hypothetical protein